MKTKKHTQPTKKLDCPVKFHVKKIFRFPEFKVEKDTKWNRSVASKKLREYLEELRTDNPIDKEKKSSTNTGHLEFVTCFPRGMRLPSFIDKQLVKHKVSG